MKRVLLVESDAALARVLARALGKRHVVETHGSAEAGLRVLGKSRFDVVVAAYRLGQGGTARRLMMKARQSWPRPRTILYLSDVDRRAQVRALADRVLFANAGFDELLGAVDASV